MITSNLKKTAKIVLAVLGAMVGWFYMPYSTQRAAKIMHH